MKVKRNVYHIFMILVCLVSGCDTVGQVEKEAEKREASYHLFILSGQSNMNAINISGSFKDRMISAFGRNQFISVKAAWNGQSIQRWYKDWPQTNDTHHNADLYDSLMLKVHDAIEGKEIKSYTFIWMQGERDAKDSLGYLYKESLIGLHNQIANELDIDSLHFVIGRINDHDLENINFPDWTKIRDIQVEVANSSSLYGWVNTDDLNDGLNGDGKPIQNILHMTADGYVELGHRFADKAVKLVNGK